MPKTRSIPMWSVVSEETQLEASYKQDRQVVQLIAIGVVNRSIDSHLKLCHYPYPKPRQLHH
ncbi:hypothetical protein T01_15491 [Trichinella spiralis]|uniref:Uncharacterized protein n=1 Tax=Trichinella spiralis TaxID=6334 RepID=A0A0V1BBA9_TRISP|nr:hypothetical protein T01_15491 [Trichinella spiralis]